jgi:hypothetical protein
MTATLNIDASALTRLNQKLGEYAAINKRLTVPEIMEKKGTDLRIQLWKLFWAFRFGGSGGKKRGIAWLELKRRSKAGRGTFVRLRSLAGRWGSPPGQTAGGKQKPRPLSEWQKLVWQETTRRQTGIGVLGVSFLSKRFRNNKAGRYLVENVSKTLGTLVQIEKDETSFTISGFTPGMVEVANKYGIANRALAAVEEDLDVYLNRKHEEARRMVFNK